MGGPGGTDGLHTGHHSLQGGPSPLIIQHMYLCNTKAINMIDSTYSDVSGKARDNYAACIIIITDAVSTTEVWMATSKVLHMRCNKQHLCRRIHYRIWFLLYMCMTYFINKEKRD